MESNNNNDTKTHKKETANKCVYARKTSFIENKVNEQHITMNNER